MNPLSQRQIYLFESVVERTPPAERTWIAASSESAARSARTYAKHRQFGRPAEQISRLTGEQFSDDGRRGLIATWALNLPATIESEGLPHNVLDLYPFWIDRLAEWLSQQNGLYDPDYWAKDVRFTLGLSVPGSRTQSIDLISTCSPGQVVRDALRRRTVEFLLHYMSIGGWRRTWLQTHTESRHTDDFNEAGWDRLWVSAAAICRARPDLAGIIGSSWFFDPPLETISPRLGYLRATPMANGAFMVEQGPGQTHSDRAAATSPTRRALIQSGEYIPRSWLLAWPRTPLISWAQDKVRMIHRPDRRRSVALDGRRSGIPTRRAEPRAADRRQGIDRRMGV